MIWKNSDRFDNKINAVTTNYEYGNLNILKFIGAILIACFLHYDDHFAIQVSGVKWPFEIFGRLSVEYGQYIVEMFFVISGFLFGFRDIQKIANHSISLDGYMWKKLKRLYPLVFISSIFAYCIKALQMIIVHTNFPYYKISLSDLILDLTMGSKALYGGVANNGPLWYVTILMICYLIAFFIVKTNSMTAVYFTTVVGVVINSLDNEIPLGIKNLSRGMVAFFVGVILCFIIKRVKISRKLSILCFFVFIGSILMVSVGRNITGLITNHTVWSSFVVFPALICATNCEWINKFGNTRLGKWMSDISFHIYVWNFPTISLMVILCYITKSKGICNIDNVLLWAVFFIMQLIIAEVSLLMFNKFKVLFDKIRRMENTE